MSDSNAVEAIKEKGADTLDRLQEMVLPVIQKAIDAMEQGADWLAGEIPLVVQELLAWKFAEAALFVSFGVALLGLAVVWAKWGFKYFHEVDRKHLGEEALSFFGAIVFGFAGPIVGAILMIIWVPVMVKIWIAPRVYLLEYAADLLKNSGF